MRTINASSADAKTRASRSARIAVGGGLLAVLSLPLLAAGLDLALGSLVTGLVLVFVGLSRHLCLTELAEVGAVPVEAVASHLPHVPPRLRSQDVISRIPELRRAGWALVHLDDGWRVVSAQSLIDTALATSEEVPAEALARHASWVEHTTPVDRLPRPPVAGEVWLVGGNSRPRALTRDILFVEQPAVAGGPGIPETPGLDRMLDRAGLAVEHRLTQQSDDPRLTR